jgi:hypothetical protein
MENQTQKKNTKPSISKNTTAFPASNRSIDTVPKAPKDSRTITSSNQKDISSMSDDYEITNDRAVIHLRNGETEEYDLKNKEQLKKFEEKYGKVINTTTTVHSGFTAPVSVITTNSIKTAIAPVRIMNASVNSTVATTVTVNSNINSPVAIAATSNVKALKLSFRQLLLQMVLKRLMTMDILLQVMKTYWLLLQEIPRQINSKNSKSK